MRIEENRDISFHVFSTLKMEMVFEKRCSERVCFGVPCQDRFQFRFVKCFKILSPSSDCSVLLLVGQILNSDCESHISVIMQARKRVLSGRCTIFIESTSTNLSIMSPIYSRWRLWQVLYDASQIYGRASVCNEKQWRH